MAVRVDTTAFEFSHGHKPKGWGNWWFGLGGAGQICIQGMTYSKAKVQAIKRAKEADVCEISVLP